MAFAVGHGPEGCDENGPAAVPRPRDRLRIDSDMRPPRVRQPPGSRRTGDPFLIATKAMLFMGQDTIQQPEAKQRLTAEMLTSRQTAAELLT
jgi:hypothetical protein